MKESPEYSGWGSTSMPVTTNPVLWYPRAAPPTPQHASRRRGAVMALLYREQLEQVPSALVFRRDANDLALDGPVPHHDHAEHLRLKTRCPRGEAADFAGLHVPDVQDHVTRHPLAEVGPGDVQVADLDRTGCRPGEVLDFVLQLEQAGLGEDVFHGRATECLNEHGACEVVGVGLDVLRASQDGVQPRCRVDLIRQVPRQ